MCLYIKFCTPYIVCQDSTGSGIISIETVVTFCLHLKAAIVQLIIDSEVVDGGTLSDCMGPAVLLFILYLHAI